MSHRNFSPTTAIRTLLLVVAMLAYAGAASATDQLLIHAVDIDRAGQTLYIDGEYLKEKNPKKSAHPLVQLGNVRLQVIYSDPEHVRAMLPTGLPDGEYQLLIAVDEKRQAFETGTFSLTIAALEKGDQGEPGPQGPQGPQGEIGPEGPRGSQGEVGETGPQGIAGPQGERGEIGPRGEKGDQGDPGPAGPAGPQGIAGPVGLTGMAGPPGPQGPQGEIGPVGPRGPQGEVGETGAQGIPGPRGERGEIGPRGEKGDQGDPGPAGPAGPQGIAGPVGLTGMAGPPGPQGPRGEAGPAGADGQDGQDGESCQISSCSSQGVATLSCANASVQVPCIPEGGNPPDDPPDDPPAGADKRVFISASSFNGNLGGLAGADAKCNTEASQAGLTGDYKAWLANNEGSPATRFTQSNSAYVLVNGTVVANDWSDLTDGSIAAPINVSATGQVLGSAQSWSNTTVAGGAKYANPTLSCLGFTQAAVSQYAYTGINLGTNVTWTDHSNVSCAASAHLMCFEQ